MINAKTGNNEKRQLDIPLWILFKGLLGQDVVEVLKTDLTITIQIGSLDDFSDVFLRHLFSEFLADSGQVIGFKGTVPVLIEKFEDSVNLFQGVLVSDLSTHNVQEFTEF